MGHIFSSMSCCFDKPKEPSEEQVQVTQNKNQQRQPISNKNTKNNETAKNNKNAAIPPASQIDSESGRNFKKQNQALMYYEKVMPTASTPSQNKLINVQPRNIPSKQIIQARNIPSKQIIQTRNIPSSQLISKLSVVSQTTAQLQIKKQTFLNSKEYKSAQTQQKNIQQLLKLASQAHTLQLYTQSQNFYRRALTFAQNKNIKYDVQSVNQIIAYAWSELTNISITLNKPQQSHKKFQRAIAAYSKTKDYSTIQERIALINNYSIYCLACKNMKDAIKYCSQAIDLQQRYYTVGDDRKYLTYINLGCLYLQVGKKDKAQQIFNKINIQCKNQAIKQLASSNNMHYKKSARNM